MRTLVIAIAALAFAASGCRASASASINTGQKQQEESFDEAGPGVVGEGEAALPEELALLGARQDLRLAPDKTTATCSCLAVALGSPNDPAFKWEGPVPGIDPESQIVVAVSSEGVACAQAKEGSIGASYWGYRQSGDDVIVIVENARLGRPLTSGAIIPRPFATGQVYVRPASKAVVYGRSLTAGEKDCKIGNPGPTRSQSTTPARDDQEDSW